MATAYPETDGFLRSLRDRPVIEPPKPWNRLPVPHIGGTVALGFSEDERYLLVVSWNGRGVISCETGEKVARDYDMELFDWMNLQTLTAEGIGPIAGERARIVSIWGGGWPYTTDDHWSVRAIDSNRSHQMVVLEPPDSPVRAVETPIYYKIYEWDPVIAHGFNASGSCLIAACSNEVNMWRRER